MLGGFAERADEVARTTGRRYETVRRAAAADSATADTFAPGTVASATIRSFAAADQRRRGTAGLASRHDTLPSIT